MTKDWVKCGWQSFYEHLSSEEYDYWFKIIGKKWQIIRVLAVMFILGSEPASSEISLVVPSSLHVLGTQTSCLSPESSCEEFKEALSRGASPRNVLHADFSQNLSVAKHTMQSSFYLDFQMNVKIFGMLFPPLLLFI